MVSPTLAVSRRYLDASWHIIWHSAWRTERRHRPDFPRLPRRSAAPTSTRAHGLR
jgi:hypothetical protein